MDALSWKSPPGAGSGRRCASTTSNVTATSAGLRNAAYWRTGGNSAAMPSGLKHREGKLMAELTIAAARKLLKIPGRHSFTEEELQIGWRTAAKTAHPDAGGSDAAMAQINAARDLLQPLATTTEPIETTRTAPARKRHRTDQQLTLTITPEGSLWGPEALLLGKLGSVAHAIAYCGAAGWDYTLGKELNSAQRMVLEGSHG